MIRSLNVPLAALLLLGSASILQAEDKDQRTWQAKCAACHGEDGKAQTATGKKMGIKDFSTAAWQKGITNDKIMIAIQDGKKPMMMAYKASLKPDQVAGLVKYIRTLGK